MIAATLARSLAIPQAVRTRNIAGLDPDALAIIAAVEAAKGSPVTSTQRAAIDAFFAAEKAAGRWGAVKRFYLPIWANAAANAICWKSRTSGTFTVSGVTHAAGYVQTDGTTGYFTSSGTMAGDGLTTSSGMIFLGRKNVPGTSSFSIGNTSPGRVLILPQLVSSRMRSDWGDVSNTHTTSGTADNIDGVFVSTRTGAGIRHSLRTSSGRAVETQARAASGSILSGPARVMGSATGFFDVSHFFSYGWALEMTDPDEAAFTIALKNLWETCTGLTLP